MRPTLPLLASVLLLAACASPPTANSTVTAAARLMTPTDVSRLKPLQQQKLQEAGVTPADIASGRLVRVACAFTTDGTWGSLALLPRGLAVKNQDVVLVRIKDLGNNDYDGVNEVLGPVSPPLTSGRPVYSFVPDWRERGLRDNVVKIQEPPEVRDRFIEVHGAWVVRCRP